MTLPRVMTVSWRLAHAGSALVLTRTLRTGVLWNGPCRMATVVVDNCLTVEELGEPQWKEPANPRGK